MNQELCFGDFQPQYRNPDTARVVILPVPYDQTSTWNKGADQAPSAILKASYNLEFYDILTDSEVFKEGIYTDSTVAENGIEPAEMVSAVRNRMLTYFEKNRFPVLLGGEHSISIGAFEAAARAVDDLTILQLDAHADTRESYEGSVYNHACVMARARQLAPIVQVGIRSMDKCEKEKLDTSRVFFAHQIVDNPRQAWIEGVLCLLRQNVYLTIDLDVFDPSVLPATGTPEPGGLSWMDIIALLRTLCAQKNLVGFDVVELCPRENLWACDFLAAKLIYQLLSFKFKK